VEQTLCGQCKGINLSMCLYFLKQNYVTLSSFICGVSSSINLVKSSPLGLSTVRKQRLYNEAYSKLCFSNKIVVFVAIMLRDFEHKGIVLYIWV
jgi:hypothetical protein